MKKFVGWVLTLLGLAYPVLTLCIFVDNLIDGGPTDVHVPTLVVSIIVACVGIALKDWRKVVGSNKR